MLFPLCEIVSDAFEIDADILIPEQLDEYKVAPIKVKRHLFTDKNELLDILINKVVIEKPSEPQERNTDYYFEDEMEEVSLGVTGDNDSFLQVRDGYIMGTNQKSKFEKLYIDSSEIGERQHPYIEWLEEDGNLSFLSADEVVTSTQELLKQLGLNQDFAFRIYAGRLEDMQKIADEINETHKEAGLWSEEDFITVNEEDEGYEVVLYQQHNGIPFTGDDMPPEVVNSTYGIRLSHEIVYQEEGISFISIDSIFDVEEEGSASEVAVELQIYQQVHYWNLPDRVAFMNFFWEEIMLCMLCGILSALGFVVTTFLANYYIGLTVPVLMYYMLVVLNTCLPLPEMIKIENVYFSIALADSAYSKKQD